MDDLQRLHRLLSLIHDFAAHRDGPSPLPLILREARELLYLSLESMGEDLDLFANQLRSWMCGIMAPSRGEALKALMPIRREVVWAINNAPCIGVVDAAGPRSARHGQIQIEAAAIMAAHGL